MEFRRSQWTESISSLLRKTEMNLIRIQTPYHEEPARSYTSINYHASFLDNQISEHPQRPPTDFKDETMPMVQQEISAVKASLEKMLNDRQKSQKRDIEEIGERLATLEFNSNDLVRFKEETRTSLNTIEKKCLAEIKRIENAGKGFVSQEDLKIAVESLKNTSLNSIRQLESEIISIKSAESDVKEDIFKMNEEKFRDISKKFVSTYEFSNLKEEMLQSSNECYKEFEANLINRIERLKLTNESEFSEFERKLSDIGKRFDDKEEKIYRKISEIENSVDAHVKKSRDEKKKLDEEIQKLENLFDMDEIEYRFGALEKDFKELPKSFPEPDLSRLANKNDVIKLNERVHELESYKLQLDLKVAEMEKKILRIEREPSDSSEIDIDLSQKPDFSSKGAATFGKAEPPEASNTPGLTKIFINDFGESDSESHGYTSPHTSPLNQIPSGPIKKLEENKKNQFVFQQKTDLHIRNTDLLKIDEVPIVEEISSNHIAEAALVSAQPEPKKIEVKQFPVESLKAPIKKEQEDTNKINALGKNKASNNKLNEKASLIDSSSSSESEAGESKGKELNKIISPKPEPIKPSANFFDDFEDTAPKQLMRPNDLKPVPVAKEKFADFEIDDIDFDLGKPAPAKLVKKDLKPLLSAAKNPEIIHKSDTKKALQEINPVEKNSKESSQEKDKEIIAFIKNFTEEFIDNEIDVSYNNTVARSLQKNSAKIKLGGIPQSIKGIKMDQFRSSSSSDSQNSSGEESFGDIELP